MKTDLTCARIMWELSYCDNEFPEAAIHAARSHREQMIPLLVREMEDSITRLDEGIPSETWGHIAALMLLVEFGATEAFPALINSVCSGTYDALYPDEFERELGSFIARLAVSPAQLETLFFQPSTAPYVPFAVTEAVFGMVCLDKVSRDTAIQLLCRWMSRASKARASLCVFACVDALQKLNAIEARKEVQKATGPWSGGGVIKVTPFSDDITDHGPEHFDRMKVLVQEKLRSISVDQCRHMARFDECPAEYDSIEEVLGKITEPFDELPVDAVRWARQHREEMTPHLIRILDECLESLGIEAELHRSEIHGAVVALCLLTEFGSRDAFSFVIRIMRLPGPRLAGLVSDYLSLDEVLGRFAEHPEELWPIASCQSLADELRHEAVDAVLWMVTENRLQRNAATEVLLDWMRQARDSHDVVLLSSCAITLLDLGANRLRQQLLDLADAGELDDELINRTAIREVLADGHDQLLVSCEKHRLNRMEHSVAYLSALEWSSEEDDDEMFGNDNSWGSDQDDDEVDPEFRRLWSMARDQVRRNYETTGEFSPDLSVGWDDAEFETVRAVRPIFRDAPKIGRNDPCPCGSGRKYKRCCATHEE